MNGSINVQNRRVVLAGLGILLGGCANVNRELLPASGRSNHVVDPRYGPINDSGYQLPAPAFNEIDPNLLRRTVAYGSPYRPGTLVVDIPTRHLYLVQPRGQAVQYTIGVGREEALNFQGIAIIGRKEEWPSWTPTATMIKRIPRYAAYGSGMAGGIENPLGARALYLYRGGQDTHFRIHGTNEPASIGTAVSSGCIRLLNHDIIDLYARVPLGAPVTVVQSG
jgi:lipoprotein-anchoring transpeptidase ErfK/SrfK